MADERLRRLERAAAQGSELDRQALFNELGRADPRLRQLEADLAQALEVARDQVNQELRRRFPQVAEEQLCPPLEVGPLLELIAEVTEAASGAPLGFAARRLYTHWPVLFALAARDETRVVVRLSRSLSEQPTLGSAWPALRGLSDKRRLTPRAAPQLRDWLAEADPDRVELPLEVARLCVRAIQARSAPPPAREKPAPAPTSDRPSPAQLRTIAALRAQLDLDEGAFAQALIDEGWLEPFDRLTRAWASVIIDALKDAVRAKGPTTAPEVDDLPEIETDQGEGLFSTEAQLDFLRVLKRRKGLDLAALREQLREVNPRVRLEVLDRGTMSQLIDALKALPDRPRPDGV